MRLELFGKILTYIGTFMAGYSLGIATAMSVAYDSDTD